MADEFRLPFDAPYLVRQLQSGQRIMGDCNSLNQVACIRAEKKKVTSSCMMVRRLYMPFDEQQRILGLLDQAAIHR